MKKRDEDMLTAYRAANCARGQHSDCAHRDRGETMQTMSLSKRDRKCEGGCGCSLEDAGNVTVFRYCPFHAAAPDLLAALTRLLDIAEDQTGVRADTDEGEMAAAQRDARAAIRKAKGA